MPKMGFLPMSLRMLATCGDERFGVAGAVGEEDAVGLERQTSSAEVSDGHHGDAAAGVHEAAEDVVLDAVIVGDHVVAGLGLAPDLIGRRARFDGFGPLVAFGEC